MYREWRFVHVLAVTTALACATTARTAPTQSPAPARQSAGVTNGAARPVAAIAGETMPPTAQNSVRFAVLGDTGTGDRAQYDVGAMLGRSLQVFPFQFVIMVGDNLYGSERPQDYYRKFELPYKPILDAKIPFYASLGNHDDPNQRYYKPFNMNEQRYYTFKRGNVRLFALDSNYMDKDQMAWLERELAASGSDWKIPFFHHPMYSSGGKHGSELDLRQLLEPLFLKHGVSVVFAGHEHFYERLKPQKGIYYFTAGGSAKLRRGDIQKTAMTAFGFDSDYTYILVEIHDETMRFQTLTRTGKRIDMGSMTRSNPSLTRN